MAQSLTKLHRSRRHCMIAGVMGGIAEYLGWSPMWTRLLFIAMSTLIAGVPGILIYVILWVVMPKANSTSYEPSTFK